MRYIYLICTTSFLYLLYFLEASFVAALSVSYAVYLLWNLLDSLGKRLPFIELTLALIGIQLIISPFLEYHYFENVIYGMTIPENKYFSFVLPSTVATHLGMYLSFSRKVNAEKTEKHLFSLLKNNKAKYDKIGYLLIVFGLVSFFVQKNIQVPSSIAFILALTSMLQFIGIFYIWVCESKYLYVIFAAVFGLLLLDAINGAVFISLIVWSILYLSFFLKKYKISKITLLTLGVLAFILLGALQSVKETYREQAWGSDGGSAIVLIKLVNQRILTLQRDELMLIGGVINARLNQGWILGRVINHIPDKQPIVKGSWFVKETIGIMLPRFIYSNKPMINDREKFKRFSGKGLSDKTAMSVGVQGDAYGNFGYLGGVIFCLFFGIFVGKSIFFIYKSSLVNYPDLILWTPLIFFYVMRVGNDYYAISNWIVKSTIFVIMYFSTFEKGLIRSTLLKMKNSLT